MWDMPCGMGERRISKFSRRDPAPSGTGRGRNLPKRSRDGVELGRGPSAWRGIRRKAEGGERSKSGGKKVSLDGSMSFGHVLGLFFA